MKISLELFCLKAHNAKTKKAHQGGHSKQKREKVMVTRRQGEILHDMLSGARLLAQNGAVGRPYKIRDLLTAAGFEGEESMSTFFNLVNRLKKQGDIKELTELRTVLNDLGINSVSLRFSDEPDLKLLPEMPKTAVPPSIGRPVMEPWAAATTMSSSVETQDVMAINSIIRIVKGLNPGERERVLAATTMFFGVGT